MPRQHVISIMAPQFTVGPLTLRALVEGGRIVSTELLLAGREWSEDKLLQHELVWYAEAQLALKREAAQS